MIITASISATVAAGVAVAVYVAAAVAANVAAEDTGMELMSWTRPVQQGRHYQQIWVNS